MNSANTIEEVMGKKQFERAIAIDAARELCQALKPVTTRLIVAGSLRRRKSQVGDVEILYVPVVTSTPSGLFAESQHNAADELLELLLHHGRITKRLNINGHSTWGPLNKLAVHTDTGVPIDFFATTENNWWVSVVFRTGSLESNLLLTRSALRHGCSLMAYGPGVRHRDGRITRATGERHVFELCRQPYREPHER